MWIERTSAASCTSNIEEAPGYRAASAWGDTQTSQPLLFREDGQDANFLSQAVNEVVFRKRHGVSELVYQRASEAAQRGATASGGQAGNAMSLHSVPPESPRGCFQNRHGGQSLWTAPLPLHPACESAPGGSRRRGRESRSNPRRSNLARVGTLLLWLKAVAVLRIGPLSCQPGYRDEDRVFAPYGAELA